MSLTNSTLMWSTICQAANQSIQHKLRLKISRARPFGPQPSLQAYCNHPMFSDPIFHRFPAPTSSSQRRASANDCFDLAEHHILGPCVCPPFTRSQKASKLGTRTRPGNDSRIYPNNVPKEVLFEGVPRDPGNTKTPGKMSLRTSRFGTCFGSRGALNLARVTRFRLPKRSQPVRQRTSKNIFL
jgi:hypothetical protein